MSINPISLNIQSLLPEAFSPGSGGTGAAVGTFSDILTETMNNAAETDRADKASAIELLTGQSDDMSGMLLDAQKAEIALNLALQVRSKVLDAYNEIMRMQV